MKHEVRLDYLKKIKEYNDERIAECKKNGEKMPGLRDFFDGLCVGRQIFDAFLRDLIRDLENN